MTGLAPAHIARLDRPVLGRMRASHSYWAVLGAIFVAFFLSALLPDSSWASSLIVLVLSVTVLIAIWTAGWSMTERIVPFTIAATAIVAAAINFFWRDESLTVALGLVAGRSPDDRPGFVDVDGLKAVNDLQGHAAGDRMLRAVAATLQGHLRAHDVVIRYGGDEFLCVVAGLELDEAAERLALVNADLAHDPQHGAVTVGLAELRAGDSPQELVARADARLYRTRQNQRPPPGS